MPLLIKPDEKNRNGVLSGALNAAVFDAVRDMPGRRRWVDRMLVFELTRANVDFLKAKFPDAVWEGTRVAELETLERLEADARAAKRAPLPKEAFKFAFKTEPRPHQVTAFNVSRDREAYGLFLEQGLGKTKVILDTAAHLWSNGKINTLLIIAPNGVHAQWVTDQMPVHMPDFVPHKALIYRSAQTKQWTAHAEDVLAYDDGLRIIAMHQEALATKKGESFLHRALHSGRALWVIDESDSIKSAGAERTKVALRYRGSAPYRRILTGTPVSNGIEDLFTQLKWLDDDVHGFSSFYTFRNRYCVTQPVPGAPRGVVKIVGYQNVDELKHRMDAWTLRLTAADCLGLPERVYMEHPVQMTEEQKRTYAELRDEMLTQLSNGTIISAEQAVVKILRLQQVLCGHIGDEDKNVHSIPTNRADEALSVAEQSHDKVMIWARFHHDIDLLVRTFQEADAKADRQDKPGPRWNPVVWDGRTTIDDRIANKRTFMEDPNCRAFIGNPSAAGRGLDGMQHASHTMIYYSNSFKAVDRWQSEARLFRDGQKGTVKVIDLVVPKSIDGYILKALKAKKDIARVALDVKLEDI